MILSPTDYRRSSKKNKVWLPVFFLLIVFIFIFSNSYAGPDKFQAPVQDTIPAKRITGRVLNLEDSTPLTGASVVNLRTGRGTATASTGIFFIEAKPGDSIRFSFAGKVAQTLRICWTSFDKCGAKQIRRSIRRGSHYRFSEPGQKKVHRCGHAVKSR